MDRTNPRQTLSLYWPRLRNVDETGDMREATDISLPTSVRYVKISICQIKISRVFGIFLETD